MKCPICTNRKNFISLSPKLSNPSNYLCENCGLVFLSDKKKLSGKLYKEDWYYNKSPDLSSKRIFVSKSMLEHVAKGRVAKMLEIYPADFQKKKVLDVGCGYGEILYYLKNKYKSNVLGIEASGTVSNYGQKMFGIKIKPVLLEEYKTNKKFDIVICNHTLEHIPDTITFLKKIKKNLKKEGLLYLEVPNILKPSGRFDLKKFFYPGHLQNFSTYNLMLLLRKIKFRVIAYDDESFLRFWCTPAEVPAANINKISSQSVLRFLNKYQDSYNIFDYFYVLANKLFYGAKLAVYMLVDFIKGH